jgi:hypothetical protein
MRLYYDRQPVLILLGLRFQMQNTNYGNGFTASHDTIVMFWKEVKEFTEPQKRQLLKFVTSCSRPPLLGFKVRAGSRSQSNDF